MAIPGDRYAALRAQADAAYALWERPLRPRISLAEDTSSLAAGSGRTRAALEAAVTQRNAAVDRGVKRVHDPAAEVVEREVALARRPVEQAGGAHAAGQAVQQEAIGERIGPGSC